MKPIETIHKRPSNKEYNGKKLTAFSYLDDLTHIIQKVCNNGIDTLPFHTINLSLIGSRSSGKTIQILAWLIELGYVKDVIIDTVIIRYEPKGAKETYDELLSTASDIYGITLHQGISNSTYNKMTLPGNHIRVKGIRSNRGGKIASLGQFRGRKTKQVQINVFEETTEIDDEKDISRVKQGTGGGDLTINIFIANPWILSMWYVAKVNKFLKFNEEELMINGQQIKQELDAERKTLNIAHITNHRVNYEIAEGQHQQLFDVKDVDNTLWRVADLGMPGTAEGLIFAPVWHKVIDNRVKDHTQEITSWRCGLDWGTSTGANGSATTMIFGGMTHKSEKIVLLDEYYHSNANQFYKDDSKLLNELSERVYEFLGKHLENILNSPSQKLVIYYDYAASTLGVSLRNEIQKVFESHKAENWIDIVSIRKCYKYENPDTIQVLLYAINNGKYVMDRSRLEYHNKEMEGAMWDPTKMVRGRPTILDKDDHTYDAAKYMIHTDLPKLANDAWMKANDKRLIMKNDY